MHTAEADKKNSFDQTSLYGKKLSVKPDDTFTVYEEEVIDDEPIHEDEDILSYDDIDDPDAFA